MELLFFHLLMFTSSITLIVGVNIGGSVGVQHINSKHGDIDTNGKFLRIVMLHLPPELIVTRNSTGHVIEVGGVGMRVLEWLSRALNFEFVLIPDNIFSVEDNVAGKGLMTWIVEDRADLILGAIATRSTRFRYLNFPYPFNFDRFGFLIPTPSAQVNVAAVWKPFQQQVWIYFFVSFLLTILSLGSIMYCISITLTKNSESQNDDVNLISDLSEATQYVIGVILAQGVLGNTESGGNPQMAIRFLTGAWCVTCFVLVTAYSSVLISFVTSPYYKPLINSVYDFPKDPSVKITVDKGLFPDLAFTNAEDGIYKYLGDQLRREPELRCSTTDRCLDKVRNGSYVYTQGDHTIKSFIGKDVRRTGRCDFTIAKERINSFCSGFALPKHTDVEYFNRGILKAHEAGLVDLWYDQILADASRCLNPVRQHEDDKIRLTLGGLSGAFAVLGFGYGLSISVLIGELFYKLCYKCGLKP